MYIAGVKNTVDTGDTYFGEIAKEPISGSRVAKVKLHRGILLRFEVCDANPLEAKIEHARYLVDCPNCDNTEFAFEDKLFFCSACKNSDIGGKVRKVKMPKERKQIEEILRKRPIKNRHWSPEETVEDLEKENTLNGLIT